MPSTNASALRAGREQAVREHMAAENRLDFDATLATFHHPRYELVGTAQVFDGEQEVRSYYAASRGAFPDQRNEIHALHQGEDAVIVEFDLLGTHLGDFLGAAPTGREFRCRMVAVFEFMGERISCERVYFDSYAIPRQLGLLKGDLS